MKNKNKNNFKKFKLLYRKISIIFIISLCITLSGALDTDSWRNARGDASPTPSPSLTPAQVNDLCDLVLGNPTQYGTQFANFNLNSSDTSGGGSMSQLQANCTALKQSAKARIMDTVLTALDSTAAAICTTACVMVMMGNPALDPACNIAGLGDMVIEGVDQMLMTIPAISSSLNSGPSAVNPCDAPGSPCGTATGTH